MAREKKNLMLVKKDKKTTGRGILAVEDGRHGYQFRCESEWGRKGGILTRDLNFG